MRQTSQKLVLLKLSITLTNSAIWIWHFPPAISIRLLLLRNGEGILISQGNSLNLQNQDFLTIGIVWFNAFLIQNRDFHHSWMFYFPSKNQFSSFPFWFHNWWTYFGSSIKILLKPILDGFELFNSSFVIPRELLAFSPLLFFFSKFGLAWIVQWDYIIIADESATFPTLGRTFKTK